MDRFRAGKRLWNPEDDALLVARYPHEPTSTLSRELRRSMAAVYMRARQLGLAKTAEYWASPEACRLRRGDNVGAPFRFKKGHVPANKGRRRPGWAPGRMKETWFKKGERQGVAVRLCKPIGTERISKDGYLERKVNDGLPLQARWRAVHLVLWGGGERSAPQGPRDRVHTRRALMARNTVHNLPKPLVETIRLLGTLNRQIRRKTRSHEEQDRKPA